MKHKLFIFLLCMIAASSVLSKDRGAYAYEEIPVQNAGVLNGIVTLEGEVPEPRAFPAKLYPFAPLCQKNSDISDGRGNILLRDVMVGPDHGLKDVVISIEDVEKGKKFVAPAPKIFSKGCEFIPFVTVVKNHGTFTMINEDPVLHNSQVYQAGKGNVILNVPVPPSSTKKHSIEFEKDRRIFQMICGMHEFMHTWGFAVENPYYAVTAVQGTFKIGEIPPGTYKVVAWHPIFDFIEKEITVPPSGEVFLELEFESEEFERSNYEIQRKFRIQ